MDIFMMMYKSALDRVIELYSFRGDERVIEDFIRSIKEDLEWQETKILEIFEFEESGKSNSLEINRAFRGDRGLEEFKTVLYEENRSHKLFHENADNQAEASFQQI